MEMILAWRSVPPWAPRPEERLELLEEAKKYSKSLTAENTRGGKFVLVLFSGPIAGSNVAPDIDLKDGKGKRKGTIRNASFDGQTEAGQTAGRMNYSWDASGRMELKNDMSTMYVALSELTEGQRAAVKAAAHPGRTGPGLDSGPAGKGYV